MFCLFFQCPLSIYIFGYQMMLFENNDDILGNIKCTVRVKIIYDISMVSCQKGPTRHAYAWQIGPFWQDTLIHLQYDAYSRPLFSHPLYNCAVAPHFQHSMWSPQSPHQSWGITLLYGGLAGRSGRDQDYNNTAIIHRLAAT